MKKSNIVKSLALLSLVALPVVSLAFTQPSSGDLAYTVYDIAVNKMLQGPIGFVSGVGLIAFGVVTGVMGKGQISSSILSVLGGGALASTDSITKSLGAEM